MCNISNYSNIIGNALAILGVSIVYYNSPLNISDLDCGSASTDFEAISKETQKKNMRMRIGVFLVILGSLTQILGSLIDVCIK